MGERYIHTNAIPYPRELSEEGRAHIRSCQQLARSRYEYSLPSNVNLQDTARIEEGLVISYLTQIGYLDSNKEVLLGDLGGSRPDIYMPSTNKRIEVATRGYPYTNQYYGRVNNFHIDSFNINRNKHDKNYFSLALGNKNRKLRNNMYGKDPVDLVIVSNNSGVKSQLNHMREHYNMNIKNKNRTFDNLFLYLKGGKMPAGLYHINDNLKRYEVEQCPLDVTGYEMICDYLLDKNKDRYEYPDFTGERKFYANTTREEERELRYAMHQAQQMGFEL